MLNMFKSIIHNMTAPASHGAGAQAKKVEYLYEGSSVKEYKVGKQTGGGTLFPRPAIIMVYAPWCPHCRSSVDDYKMLGDGIGDYVNVLAVNGDDPDNKQFLVDHEIRGFPSLLFAKKDISEGEEGISEIDMSDTSRDLGGFVKKICLMSNQQEKCCDMSQKPFKCTMKRKTF
jgi:thiol-disulfide isomerase/thioredoxin